MAKVANPLGKIATKLVALQAKSAKLNDELSALTKMVADEAKKAAAAPVVAKAPAKKAVAKKPAAKKVAAPVKK